MSPTAARQNELLDELALGDAAEARRFARRMRLLAELAACAYAEQGATGVEQFAAMEVAGTCRMGKLAASLEMAQADRFVDVLPLTLQLLEQGVLFVRQARALYDVTERCSPEVAGRVERLVLTGGGSALAPVDLRRNAKRAVLQVKSELDADGALERLTAARAARRVVVRPQEDGMSRVTVDAPAEQVRQWQLDLERLVRQEQALDREAGVWRSADQVRSDLLMAMPRVLLELRAADGLGRTQPRQDALVSVLVPVSAVLERGHEPGQLDGYGPISAAHVRLLRPHAVLRRACVDADTGRLLELDDEVEPAAGDDDVARQRVLAMLRPSVAVQRAEPQHDPSTALRRFVQVRSPRCDGVGCSCSSKQCHLDHRKPYPGGPTAEDNLDPRSGSCHRAKHNGWQVRIEEDGSTTWTSPLGRTYRRPPPYDPPVLPPAPTWEPLPRADDDEGEAAA